MNDEADLNLCWAHMSRGMSSDTVAQLFCEIKVLAQSKKQNENNGINFITPDVSCCFFSIKKN